MLAQSPNKPAVEYPQTEEAQRLLPLQFATEIALEANGSLNRLLTIALSEILKLQESRALRSEAGGLPHA